MLEGLTLPRLKNGHGLIVLDSDDQNKQNNQKNWIA